MKLLYQNETLFIDVETSLNAEKMAHLKRKIFHILDDYEIDQVVMYISKLDIQHEKQFQKLFYEYQQKYSGTLLIKWI